MAEIVDGGNLSGVLESAFEAEGRDPDASYKRPL